MKYILTIFRCPYVAGNTITVQLEPHKESIAALITHVFEPFTLSCVMVVRLFQKEGLGKPTVLKLFDRRFASQLREEAEAEPWTMESEAQYHRFIQNGGAAEFITSLEEDSMSEDEEGDVAKNEAYLHHEIQRLYKTEREVYSTLKDLQGKHIPRLLHTLTFPAFSTSYATSKLINKYTAIPGIILQHIDGFTLSELSVYAPKSNWQSICDQAIRTISQITLKGVLNADVKTRNIIVSKDQQGRFRVFVIDFGTCHFRRECERDREWWAWKAGEDEEGAVGYVMQRMLKGRFVYRRSALSIALGQEYMRA